MRSVYVTPEEYAIAEKNGISSFNVYQRVNVYNWNTQRAITTPLGKCNALGWTENKQLAKKNGIGYDTYYHRVTAMGWDPLKAATTQPLKRRRKRNA